MPKEDKLKRYRAKRDPAGTPEPAAGKAAPRSRTGRRATAAAPRFVIQEHSATRLHWDLRLERDGVLASWAIPNGIPPDPQENRLAVRTEDHPLEYLDFHGEIPKGQYGAGTMTIWDTGTYELHKWEPRKVEVTFHGERLRGRYGLFPIGRGQQDKDDWMIHRMDPPADPGREPMPEHLIPMMARLSAGLPPAPSGRGWWFEIKWDGVRAIAYAQPGRLRLESRNLNEITDRYPEIKGLIRDLGMHEAVLDGEIVAFDESDPANPRPSFERLQRRMHLAAPSAIRRLQQSIPVVYAIFDLLYLDGRSLCERPYTERRQALESLELHGPAWRVPAAVPERGEELLRTTRERGLEGIVAKRADSRYEPGRRPPTWLKIKNTLRKELVIGGWLPGEGRRANRVGALLTGYHADGELVFAGRVGTGFTEKTLDDLAARLEPLVRPTSPFTKLPDHVKLPRSAQFVEPRLVAEIEFREWTSERIMRAPSYKGLREDKQAEQVVAETDAIPAEPAELFETAERLPRGVLRVTVDARELKLSNWDKVMFPKAGFTKGDLIAYYTRIAPVVLPHLHDRALTLKRYPNGVQAGHFYEKNSPKHRPDWVATGHVDGIDYTLAQDRPTLVWLANLADVELHTSLALVQKPDTPTMLVFDLDPGAPADLVQCCEVGMVICGLFDQLGLRSFAKTSGSKGLQVYVPLNTRTTYEQTKPFAKRIAEVLEERLPKLVVSRMSKQLRKGKVLVDWSQNDFHKTTVSVYSVRAREQPTVSTPVSWEEVAACREAGDPGKLTFTTDQVLARVEERGDEFAPLLSLKQKLPRLD